MSPATAKPMGAQPGVGKQTLEEQLRALEKRASEVESGLRQTSAVLEAISCGGLLDAAPTDTPGDYERHGIATTLLDLLRQEIGRLASDDSIELEVSLFDLASEAKTGRVVRRAVTSDVT